MVSMPCALFFFARKGKHMNRKNYKRHLAYEVLVVLSMSVLVLYICRIWPLLILALLGMLPAIAWLMVSNRSAEAPDEPKPLLMIPSHERNEALSHIQVQISELVRSEYPNARWIWKTPNAKALAGSCADALILLNRAGGYREAIVHMDGSFVTGIEYLHAPEAQEIISRKGSAEHSEPVNYELLAFEWVDANIISLNGRCNEGIAKGLGTLLLEPGELPERESWREICRELERNGVSACECTDEGICISLSAERS
jgi:hypothetical protein